MTRSLRATRRFRRCGLVATLAVAVALSTTALPSTAASADTIAMKTVQARPADTLPRMSGVNTHLLYGGSPYGDYARTKRDLLDLGVRRIRDGFAPDRSDHHNKLNDLAANGIKSDVVVATSVDRTKIGTIANALAAKVPRAVDGIEPPNEWNINGGSTWAADMRAYQRALYKAVRERPALNQAKVHGPSLARRMGYSELGYLGDVLDYGNIHLYSGGDVPTNRMVEQLQNEKIVAGSKPAVVTEMGYHNALKTSSTHPPTSEAAVGIYTPRLFLEYFNRRVPRVYQYELYDSMVDRTSSGLANHEAHFGLIARDGRRKPAYHALRNLLALADDPGPAFTPGRLSYSLTRPGTLAISQTVLQRRDGRFVLLLWRNASVWDFKNRASLPVSTVNVTIGLASAVREAKVYRPSLGALPRATHTATSSVTVPLGADVTAVALTPR